jgi:hypothetical protein
MQFPGMNFDATASELQAAYPTPDRHSHSEELVNDDDWMGNFHLPTHDLMAELVELFFDNLYHMFPCFHRRTFQAQMRNGIIQQESSPVLYAICCVAARYHPVISVKARQKDWYEQAKFLYQLTERDPCPALRTIQAALLVTFHASTAGDYSSSWLFLGKAWRQAVALGMNRMDASKAASMSMKPQDLDTIHANLHGTEEIDGTNAVEKEEYRRTLWLLFIMDRNHAWPTGWPNAIPETHFKVDIPIADSLFQAMDSDMDRTLYDNMHFTRNLNHLITSPSSAQGPINIFHYVCIAYILLSRVAELIHSLHDAPDTPEYAEECEALDSHIVKFRMSLPRQATSILEAPHADRGHVVWFQVILNTSAMLLNYRCASEVPVANTSSQFLLAVAAARNIAQIVKDASRVSIDLLLSAHIGSSLYVAACILVIQWRATGDPKLKDELDLFMLVFDRMNEVFLFLGLKFKVALEHDMQRSTESLEDLKNRGFRGLLADCSKWRHVKEAVQRRGLPIDIT